MLDGQTKLGEKAVKVRRRLEGYSVKFISCNDQLNFVFLY